ncbi:MAG: hypothetical protein NXY57DRAFT_1017664 [Lentinula lateritia]|nr:MAG: hypothetical protein NXY57DRAFT_1017664 [Lentinula lateritia]
MKIPRAKPCQTNLRDIWAWNPPVRRSGHRILDAIPAELYIMIFDYVKPRNDCYESKKTIIRRTNDLRNMSLVCRYFCAEILPWLFKSVVFHPGGLYNGVTTRAEKDAMSYIPFCRSIKQDEKFARSLALQVKQCSIRDWLDAPNTNTAMVKAFLNTHIDSLPHLTNLTAITLSRMPLAPQLLAHIRRLLHLTSFTIDRCDFAEISPKHVQKLAAKSKLKSFRLWVRSKDDSDDEDDEVHALVVKEFLPLIVNLSEFGTDSWLLMQALISCHDTLPPLLETLEILSIRDTKVLCEYLYKLPALTSLTMDSALSTTVYSNISLSRLTSLRHLTCPPHFVSHFSGSHELASLSFSTRRPDNSWVAIHNAAGVSWPRVDQLLAFCLPYTLALGIGLDPTSFLDGTGIVLDRLRKLTIISDECFILNSGGTPDQNGGAAMSKLVQILMKEARFPSLECILFRDDDNKEWIWREDSSSGKWKPVPEEDEDVY